MFLHNIERISQMGGNADEGAVYREQRFIETNRITEKGPPVTCSEVETLEIDQLAENEPHDVAEQVLPGET